jgi:hypothetical protein
VPSGWLSPVPRFSSTAAASTSPVPTAPATPSVPPALPPPWIIGGVDPLSGAPYYVNTATRESAWTKPEGAAAAPAGPPSSAPLTASPAAPSLPAAWRQLADPRGVSYFVGPSGQPQWEPPSAPVGANCVLILQTLLVYIKSLQHAQGFFCKFEPLLFREVVRYVRQHTNSAAVVLHGLTRVSPLHKAAEAVRQAMQSIRRVLLKLCVSGSERSGRRCRGLVRACIIARELHFSNIDE